MDLNLFRLFNAVYQQRSLTKAAEVLRLTQPAISHGLGRLREQFNDPLFVRQGHSMQPTPKAKAIVDDIRQALALLERTVQPAEFNPLRDTRTFSLGLRDILEGTIVPRLIEQHPTLMIKSTDIRRSQAERQLASGELDLIVDVWSPKGNDVEHQKLSEDRWVVLMRQGHPLADQPLTEDAYLASQHILVSGRKDGPSWIDFELDRIGMKRKVSLRHQHYFPAAQSTRRSDLLLTVTESYGAVLAEACQLKALPMPVEMTPMEVHLFWHQRAKSDPGMQWLKQAILDIHGQ